MSTNFEKRYTFDEVDVKQVVEDILKSDDEDQQLDLEQFLELKEGSSRNDDEELHQSS